MKNIILFTVVILMITSCNMNNNSKISYPETRKGDIVDTYFGTSVPDPYRWLEDDMSNETAAWVKAQNEVTFAYLNRIPYRNEIRLRLERLWNYERFSAPFTEGDFTYFFRNDGLQNQSVLYRQKGDGEPEVFLDPNLFSEDGTTSLGSVDFSKDGSLVAYTISEGGSDWRKAIVMNTINKQIIGDTLIDIKFSSISWRDNSGFYYSSYDKPEGSELSAMTDQHKLYYHKIGTPQSDDTVIFGGDKKRRYVSGDVTEDGRYLVISAAISTTGNELYIMDLTSSVPRLVTVVDNFNSNSYVIDNKGTTLVIGTNYLSPNNRVVSVDASSPGPENWKDLIPETENVLQVSTGAGCIFANYLKDAISSVLQYDMDGNIIREIGLPGVGSASGLSGKKSDTILYYSFTNYITPSAIYRYDPAKGSAVIYKEPDVAFDRTMYESLQVFYAGADGTRIPMIITYKKGTVMDGSNPTILYGYGGFSISETPSFSAPNAVWLEMGGIYAVPNIRGGGEYGEEWHLAGTKLNKQNVFDDFIAAAEYLIQNRYTSSDYLAIRGGSNGGLLVGAVMTQRPDLMKVVLPAVGVLDMLRYHTFTAGAGWAYDYGTAEESEEMFRYLLGYSPVQNVKKGVKYPATLITTGDHDDRVVPAHSFKFAAQLQAKQAGKNPVLIRIETNAGHGAGTPVSKSIEQYADIFGFTLWSMGIKTID